MLALGLVYSFILLVLIVQNDLTNCQMINWDSKWFWIFVQSVHIYIWNKWNRPTVSFYLIQAKSCVWFLVTKDNTALFRLRMLSSCECMSGAISWLFSKTKACRNNYMTAQCITNICLHNIFHLYSSFSNTYKIGFCFQQNSILFQQYSIYIYILLL